MGFLNVPFLPSRTSLCASFLNTVVVVNALGPPHVLKLWLGVSKGMLSVKYFRSNKSHFCVS